MTDPKDELKSRFDERRPDRKDDDRGSDEDEAGDSGNTNDSSDAGHANDASNMTDTQTAATSTSTEPSEHASNTSDTSGAGDTGDTSSASKPGPDRNANATRHRKQVPMYLPDEQAKEFNQLYERLDGRSKVAGEGGIEKHADFMEAVVKHAIENEDKLAEQLGITIE